MSSKEKEVNYDRGALFKWPVLIAVAVVFLLGCYAWAKKTVVVDIDGSQTAVTTFSLTVGGLLNSQDIALLEKDEVTPSLDSRLKKGMVVTIKRATDLTIAVDGTEIAARTMTRKVEDALLEYGISLGPEDEVEPAKDDPVSPGMTVKVVRIKTENQVCEAPIDYETKKQYTILMPGGASRVAQEGKEGKERQTWQVTFKDGQEIDRQLVSREVLEPPTDKIVVYGSTMAVSRGGENIRYSRAMDMLASAYTYTGSNTASGAAPHYGVAAVDTSVIPMGTRLYVDGYGYATALDRGSAIRGNRIDLFFGSYGEAMGWGLRRVKVYVLD
ncbi:ubiquitin-like domain-containing protein [Pelotomaculum terephthalicicum JT]|uniref:ubiquitin-like domain-containing protein n=1 Tax=Pelotomaculum TaxID=191373 RepID=UPI0009CF1FDB|nr:MULTISPECIES: ubiquitin-like domain-containing protein [Pelotomaculum]MCG9968776.1 ubiquitin-like domain-containing protein [Pelotomaculum terephthalicicum JT]OPX84633.1 MAG: Cell wall-binding protein YocH precursor [Pelotomaculum sp. PtaB.Bin117]OPY63324.1 MAG: Cell wall-binding protein YocH precursor [Pelotomaculum sp. PtaU1.Bin065]